MKRTSILVDEQTIDRLTRLAADRGVPLSEVVREALEKKASEYRPKPSSMGTAQSRPSRTGATRGSKRLPPRSWR